MPKKKRRGVAAPPVQRKKKSGAGRPTPSPHITAAPSSAAPLRAEVVSPRPAPPSAARRPAPLPALDLAQEYGHIRGDLGRLALVGGGILIFLIILSLVMG